MKKWSDVTADPRYQSAAPELQERIRNDFFTNVIAPDIPEDVDAGEIRRQFDLKTDPMLEKPTFLSAVKDRALANKQLGLDIIDSVFGEEKSVVAGKGMDNTPAIERRGGPLSEEGFAKVKGSFENADEAGRDNLTKRPGAIGNAARKLDEAYQQADAKAPDRITDRRIESREKRLLQDGLTPETARAVSAQGGDVNTISKITPGIPDREIVDYALDTVRDVAKIAPQTGKMVIDTARLSGEYIPIVGDILTRASAEASAAIEEIAKRQSPELQAKSRELQMMMQTGDRAQVTAFLAKNPSVMSSIAIPSAGSMLVAAGPGIALRAIGASAEAATTATVASNALMNAGSAFSEAQGDPVARYTAALIAGGGTLLIGRMTEGGAEGAIARGFSGGKSVASRLSEGAKIAGREYAQEFVEGGSEATGTQVADVMSGTRDSINPQQILNQAQVEGAAGLLLGGGVGMLQTMQQDQKQQASEEAQAALDAIPNANTVDEAIALFNETIKAPITVNTPPLFQEPITNAVPAEAIDAAELVDGLPAEGEPDVSLANDVAPVPAGVSGLESDLGTGSVGDRLNEQPGDAAALDGSIRPDEPVLRNGSGDAAVTFANAQEGQIVDPGGQQFRKVGNGFERVDVNPEQSTPVESQIQPDMNVNEAPNITRATPTQETVAPDQAPVVAPFDSNAFDKEREDRIKASKEAGNTHLDQIPAYVETMRGKSVYYAHDPKVRGIIRTVDNRGNVYVDWSDKYSADKELASPSEEKRGKKTVTVYRTSLGTADLKDYVLGNGEVSTAASTSQVAEAAPVQDYIGEPQQIAYIGSKNSKQVLTAEPFGTDGKHLAVKLNGDFIYDYDSGEEVTVPVDATLDDIKKAVKKSGQFNGKTIITYNKAYAPQSGLSQPKTENAPEAKQDNASAIPEIPTSDVVQVEDIYGRTHSVRQGDLDGNADRIPTVRKSGEVVSGEEIPRSIIKDKTAAVTSTAPEHAAVGVDDRELSEIVEEFNAAQQAMVEGDDKVTHVFDAPAKDEIVRLQEKTKVYHKDHGWMTVAEAKARIAEWKAHVKEQYGNDAIRSANSQRVVLSLFDLTGKWSQPWEEAGYQVYRFDIQTEEMNEVNGEEINVGDINNFSTEFFNDLFGSFDGNDVYAILAATPCTDFAVSGARHFAAKDADGRTVASVKLVHMTLATVEYFKPSVWAIENPVGRIEKLGGLPPWRLSFDPNHLGDPYTKKTLLWGRFNADLPIAPVEPTEGSKMHQKYGGKSLATKNARSATPEGFSYGFFMANNAHDHPAMAIANKYDRLDRNLIEQAIAAGVTEEQINNAVEDFYYMDLDDEAANNAIRDLLPTPPEDAEDARKAEIEIARSNRAKAMIAERMKLNPSTDDLFAAMAKLGGLKKDDAVSEFGLDPADLGKYRSGLLFSFTNGKRALTPDGMREALAQYGYDVGDTVAEFGDKLDNAIRGIQQERTQEDAAAEKIKAFEESQQEYSEAYDALSEADQETVDQIVDAAIAAIGDAQVSAIMAEVATENPGESVNTTFFRTQLKERINDHIAAQEARKQAGANAEAEAGRTAENRGGESGVSPDDRQEVGSDLFGDSTATQQSLADAARAKDTKRNSGESNPDDFTLTGSDRAADQAIARGARDLFDQPDEVSKAKEALNAAGVTGTDKLNTIAQVRDGKLTAEEVAEAHDVSQWDAMPITERQQVLAKYFGPGTDGPERYATRKWDSFNVGEKSSLQSAMDKYGKQDQSPDLDDRDHFTLERLNRDTDKMESVTFERGEYVRYQISGNDNFGEIDGISHSRREFSVDGLWYPFGFAYKAERPASIPDEDAVPLSSVIDDVNAKHGEGLDYADRIHTLAVHKDLFNRVYEGNVTADELKASFDGLLKNKDAIIAELNGMTKPQIFKQFPDIEYRYKNEKKDRVVTAAYRDMLDYFVMDQSVSYVMGEKYDDVIRRMVDKVTDEQLANFAQRVKKSTEERQTAIAERTAGMQNPQTLEDYTNLLRGIMAEGKTLGEARMTLTPEQREQYDTLAAAKSRSERADRKNNQKTAVQATVTTTTGDIIETKHTKTGEDLFVVKAAERVERDVYNQWNTTAKRLGGWYSSFRGNGAVPGFQFKTRESAEAFLQYLGGDVEQAKEALQARRDTFADDRSQSAVERLTEMADKLEERADASLGQERKANTARRARFAASAEAAASGDKAMAQTMRNIASGIENGTVQLLDQVRQKVQVEMLQGMVRTAHDEQLRKLYPSYADLEKHRGEKPTKEVADFVTYPAYTAYRSDLASLGRSLLETEGTKKLGQRIMSVADDVTEAYLKFARENLHKVSRFSVTGSTASATFPSKAEAEKVIARSGFNGKAIVLPFKRGQNIIILSPSEAMKNGIWEGDNDKRITLSGDFGEELVEKLGKVNRSRGRNTINVPWQFENAYDKRKRLAGMGIETPQELRAAIREFVELREAPKEADKIKQMERAMIGRRNDGLDFFPTPASVADEMIESADLKEGMAVLEPSAGMGHIADRIREAGIDPDVVELSGDRRELLQEKGFNIVGHDFMDVQSETGYDRIIMNPPFGDRRDAEHVRHAYTLLKPGGRIVAIMGEGVFFGQDKKAQAFRDWLEQVGASDEKLEEGTFLDPSLPVNTGVNARMVVIDKSESAPSFSRAQTEAPEFKAWFGSSKVVDSDGKPLVVYHGTASTGIESFMPHDRDGNQSQAVVDFYRKAKENNDRFGYMNFRAGTFFSPHPEYAGNYTAENTGVMYPVYIKAENPIYFDQRTGKVTGVDPNKTPDALMMMDGDTINEVAVIDPLQVKSAIGNHGPFDPSNPDIRMARGDTQPSGITLDKFKQELATSFGEKTAEKLIASGVIVPLKDQTQLPAHVVPFLRTGDIVFGFYDPKTNRTYAVLENLTPDMIKGLTLHEVGTHYGFKKMLGESKYQEVMNRLDTLRRAGSKEIKKAYAEASANAVNEKQVPEETLAYLVQNHPTMSIIKDVIARIKAFLFREFGIAGKYLNEDDLTMLAKAAVNYAAWHEQQGSVEERALKMSNAYEHATGAAYSRENRQPSKASGDTLVTAAMEFLARDPELFQRPLSEVKDIYGIAKEIDPGYRVERVGPSMTKDKGADRAWEVFVPGSDVRSGVIMTNYEEVWIDVSRLQSGIDSGSAIYDMAAAYAHNNGKVLIGDPLGLSRMAYYRRNENMLSSALKYGTTRHLRPHLAQEIPSEYFTGHEKAFGESVRPLNWIEGDDVNNIREMIYNSWKAAIDNAPELKDVIYDPATQQFQYVDGRPFTDQDSERIAAELSRASRPYRAGSATQKRATLFNTFLRKEGGETRRQVLGELVDQLSRGGLSPALNGIFYSRSNQTQTPEFKRWFGDSEVVDAKGNPLVVYHGTNAQFDTFKPADKGMYGGGIYFTSNIDKAKTYGTPMPVYVSIQNPMPRLEYVELFNESNRNMWTSEDIREEVQARGYDGIITQLNADNIPVADIVDGDEMLVIAFLPEQIKSAIGNNGDFDGNNSNILFSRQGSFNPSWDAPEPSKFDDLIYTLQDKNIDLKRVTQEIQKAGNEIDDRWNAYLQEELYHGRTAKRTQDFIREELDPLVEDMQARKVTMADFEEYLWMRHAEERNAQIAKVNPEMPDSGSGVSTAEAQEYLDSLSDDKRADFEALAARIDSINAKSRQLLIDYGLESMSTIKAWQDTYKHYVPLMREEMDHGFGNGTGQGFSVRGNAAKRATGSKRAVVDILANIAMQREKNIIRGEKNRVATALIGLAKLNPNPEFWNTDTVPQIKDIGKDGLVTYRPDPNYKGRENVIVARIVNKQGKIVEHSVIFNQFDERAQRMAASLKNLDQDQIGELLGVASSFTRYFASINTQYNPVFGAINITRDVQGALFNLESTPLAGKQKEVTRLTGSALKGIYQEIRAVRKGKKADTKWAQLWEEFQKEGGKTGFRDMYRNAKVRGEALEHAIDPEWWQKKKWGRVVSVGGVLAAPQQWLVSKPGKALFDWLSDYNDTLENSVRLAAYKVALNQGLSKQQSASIAKNLTVNFNRKGEMGRQIGSLYAFFNASVQGTARIGETLFKEGKMTRAGKQIIGGGMLLGGMQALMLAFAGYDDDEPPEFVRDRNLVIPLDWINDLGGPDLDDKYFTIPMPLGYNAIPATGRILTEWAMDGFDDTQHRFAHLLEVYMDMFNPIGYSGISMQTLAPTALDPFAALAENKDWTGMPIAREDFSSLNPTPGFTRSKDTASSISKGMSYSLNWMTGGTDYTPGVFSPTPDQIDYLIGQFTGGVGREYMKLEQTASSMVTGDELPTYKIPLVGRFYGDASGQTAQGGKFYDNLIRMNKHSNEIKGRMESGGDVDAYLAENPEAELADYATSTYSAISKLRKQRNQAKEEGGSKAELKEIDQEITDLMREFNDEVRKIKDGAPA
jgi:hypothetical protein